MYEIIVILKDTRTFTQKLRMFTPDYFQHIISDLEQPLTLREIEELNFDVPICEIMSTPKVLFNGYDEYATFTIETDLICKLRLQHIFENKTYVTIKLTKKEFESCLIFYLKKHDEKDMHQIEFTIDFKKLFTYYTPRGKKILPGRHGDYREVVFR